MSLFKLVLLATFSLIFVIYFGVKKMDMEERKKKGVLVNRYDYYGVVSLFSIPLGFLMISLHGIQAVLFDTEGLSSWIGWIIAGLAGSVLLNTCAYFVKKLRRSSNTASE